MRIRGAKTELEEAGLETDGMAESTSKLREEILALSGVDIMIDDSTFKSTYDIVLELAQVWDTLTDVSQANISELLAGKRGGNVINSLMTNADLLEETYATALGSEGSAEKELENYQQGVEYSIGVFKASWEELSNTILSSDLLKTVVDIGSGFLSTINSITSALGGFGTTLTAIPIVAFLANFKNLKNIGNDILGSSASGFSIVGETDAFIKGVNGLTAAMAGLGEKAMSMWLMFTSFSGWQGVIAAVAGVAVAIAGVNAYMNRFNDSVEKAVESLNDFQTEQENLDSLESQSEDIKSTLEDLADTYSVDISGLDDVNSMIDKIESVDGIKITDKATLEDLRGENTELERQIALQEKVVEQSQQKAEADAIDVVTMKSTPDLTQGTTRYALFGEGIETYDTENVITATKNELDALARLYDARNQGIEDFVDADTKLTISDIGALEDNISSQIEAMDSVKESLAGTAYYDQITDLENQFANIDLSPLGRQLASLDTYFSADGMENVKNTILDAVAAGENASDVFQGLGLSLDSIADGLDASTFDSYFNDLIADAQAAEEAIGSVEGTVDSMSDAASTANQNANWESAASLLSDAKDLYEKGLIGTDDFKEAAQYMSPEKLFPNDEDYKYDANAYVKAWEDAQSKVKRYFDADNPATSMTHALKDLTKAGLAISEGDGLYEWTDQFTNSKQAADAFGISVSAAEDILHGLEAYGADVSDIFFSSEGLEEYETYLEGIRSVYDSIGEGDTKDRIGTLLEGFDEEYAQFQEDITGLDNEAIVRIKFEYDLANLDNEIEGYRTKIAAGDTSASITSEMYSAQRQRNAIAAEQAGLNVEGVEIPVIAKIDQKESDIQAQIEEATKNGATEADTLKLRTELSNLEDVKSNLLDTFNDSEYAINVDEDTTAANVQDAWSSYLSSGDMSSVDLVANLSVDDTEAIQTLSEITGMSPDEIMTTISIDDSSVLSSFANLATIAEDENIHVNIDGNTDSIKADLDNLADGNTLIFTADVGDVETAIAGVQTMDGVINYVVDESVDENEVRKTISSITGQNEDEIIIRAVADTDQAMSDISNAISGEHEAVKIPTELNTDAVNKAIDSIGKGTTVVKFEADVDGVNREITQYTEADGTIVYSTNIDGVEEEIKPIERQYGVISYTTDIEADTSSAVDSFVSLETLIQSTTITIDAQTNAEDVVSELESLDVGNTLIFTADVSGVETAIAGIQTMDGVINYVVDESVDVDEAKRSISEITGQSEDEIIIRAVADTDRAMHDIDNATDGDHNVKVIAEPSGFDEIEEAVASASEEQTVRFIASVDGVETIVDAYKDEDGTIAYTASIDGVASEIAGVQNEDGTITFTADTSGINSSDFDENATVTYNPNTVALPESFDKSATVTYNPDTSALPSSFSTITRYVNYVATGDTGGASVNGTAHASGTAKATGDVDEWSAEVNRGWLTKKSETALTGELGRELVVDTRNNRWYTVGDNGAEFTYIPAGSIVFNHQQTEDLLTTGSTDGTAHASGTAYGGVQIKTSSSSSSSKSSSSSSSSKSSSSSSSSSKKSSSSSSKKKSSSSSSSSKDFEESLDWIEIEIDRIERAIDRLDLKAESTYNNWTTRNKNLADEIAKINEEISIQQQAYDRYIQQANSVGLSSKYVTLVQNGAIDISTITDEDLADQIKEYQEWYEKALDCKDAIDELTESVKSLYEEAFQNIQDEFDAIINVYEHQANMLEGYIKQTEAQGYITSTQYYTALIENEEEQLNYLEEERTRLVDALNDAVKNGGIDEYSESWYNMCAEIDKVDEAIQDATTSIIEFGNSIRDIEWEIFDLIEDNISHITTEADFLIDLMSSRDMYDTDTGEITDVGRATFGLHAVNYNTYMEQADDYAEEIKNIDKELADDPYNQDLLDRRQELLELQQQSILSAEDEKQAIKDLVEDGINAELDALQNLIDEYTDLLDTEKDMYDYSKKIAEQQKNISSLEKQLSAYQGDTSEEGAARRQKLQNELNEAQEELEQTQYEQAIAETKKLLNDLYDEYEKILNERLDDIDMLISDVITNVNADSELIYETIQEQAEAVGYTISDSMNTVWESQKDVVTGYCENFTSSLTGIQTSINDIKALVQKQVDASNKTASSNVKTATTSATTSTKTSTATTASSSTSTSTSKSTQGDGTVQVGDKVTYNSGKYYNDSYGSSPSGSKYQGKSVYVTKIVSSPKSGQNYPIHISTGSKLGNGDLGWLKKSQISGYASGTKSVKDDELSEINEKGREIVVSGGNPTLVDLKRGDGVISNKLTENLMDWGAVTPQDVLEHLNPEIRTNKQMDVDKNVEVNIAIDKVEDYNDFIRQLQNDDKAERLIQSICYGEVTGRGKLGKYNVKLD